VGKEIIIRSWGDEFEHGIDANKDITFLKGERNLRGYALSVDEGSFLPSSFF